MFDFSRRGSSTASSIFDLTYEAEQLDRAIRDNDAKGVRKLLDLHLNKFNVQNHRRGSYMDRLSVSMGGDSVSRRCSQQDVQSCHAETEHLLRRSFPAYDRERRASSTTDNTDTGCVPLIFRNALHVAVQHSSYDVLNLLLTYGIDPNEPGISYMFEGRRFSSISEILTPRRDVRFMLPGSCGSQRLRDGSDPPSEDQDDPVTEIPVPLCTRHQDSNDGVTGDRIAAGVDQTHRDSMNQSHRDSLDYSMKDSVDTSHRDSLPSSGDTQSVWDSSGGGSASGSSGVPRPLDFACIYTVDVLQMLPPLFLAVAERNVAALRSLLLHGASPNIQDVHGCTPLHLAASLHFQSWPCATALIEHGGKVHVTNKQGITPCDLSPDLAQEQIRLLSDTLLLTAVLRGGHAAGDGAGNSGAGSWGHRHQRHASGRSSAASSSIERRREALSTASSRLQKAGDPLARTDSSGKLSSRLFRRFNSHHSHHGGHDSRRANTDRHKRKTSWDRGCDYLSDRERSSSVTSLRSRFSISFGKRSTSPPLALLDDFEMDTKSLDPEKVGPS